MTQNQVFAIRRADHDQGTATTIPAHVRIIFFRIPPDSIVVVKHVGLFWLRAQVIFVLVHVCMLSQASKHRKADYAGTIAVGDRKADYAGTIAVGDATSALECTFNKLFAEILFIHSHVCPLSYRNHIGFLIHPWLPYPKPQRSNSAKDAACSIVLLAAQALAVVCYALQAPPRISSSSHRWRFAFCICE